MIYDQRTYTCQPGTLRKYIEIYEKHGYDVQREYIGEPVLIAVTEVGNVNSYVHIWAYASMADREEKRKKLRADPRWQDYLRLSDGSGYLVSQQNTLLVPVPFVPAGRG